MSRLHMARVGAAMAVGTWATLIGAGLLAILRYESTPGPAGSFANQERPGGPIHLDPSRANLIMLAHPRCPCTRASLEELARVMDRCRNQVAAHVLFFRPDPGHADWARSDLWSRAAAIPGVSVLDDPGGAEAARLGARTSGSVLLYDRSGRQLYAGGITGARGHLGDNPGRAAIIAHLSGERPAGAGSPVFGCALRATPQIASRP